MTGYDNNAGGTWVCNCGNTNTGKFCVKCGSPRPAAPAPENPTAEGGGKTSVPPSEWVCACGARNTSKFCVTCGAPRPSVEETAARQAAEARAAQEAAARKAAEETAARQAAEARAAHEAAARRAAEETAVRQAAEARAVQAREASEVPVTEAGGNRGMLMKAAIGVAVLLLLIGAYFMFGRKKEALPAPELPKTETKAETKAEIPEKKKADTEKPMDPAVKAEKLKKYAAAVKAANAQKKQDAIANGKLVFLVEDVKRAGNDLVVYGRFYNGKKNRTIITVKGLVLDIVLRDVDKEVLNEKDIKYGKVFSGMNIKPLKDSQVLTVNLPGKAPEAEFNNFMVTAHDVHWEAVGG